MTMTDELPHPDECVQCLEARTCKTTSFEARQILDPLHAPDQTIQDYLKGLCECGQQVIVHFLEEPPKLPEFIPHTKMCIAHTIRWMTSIQTIRHNWIESDEYKNRNPSSNT